MGKRRRGGNPNYYARRTERARREAAARAAARSPEAIAAGLLKGMDLESLTRSLTASLERAADRMDRRRLGIPDPEEDRCPTPDAP